MASYIQLKNNTRGNVAKKVPQRSPVLKDYPTLIKDDFKLSENGLSLEQQDLAWKKIHDYLHAYNSTFIGYQINQSNDCTDRLKDYLDLHVNNIGDPFVGGKFNLNTKVMECSVLDYFAQLWNIALRDSVQGKDRDEAYWGYVLSMGCTEANIYALYNARDYLSGEPLLCNDDSKIKQHCTDSETSCSNGTDNPNAFTPVAFYSEDAHYSLAKTMVLLKISTFHKLGSGHFPCPLTYPDDYPTTYCEDYLDQNGWPRLVPVCSDGSMYLPALFKLVSAFVSRGYPPIVIFTIGTTFTGAYDNPQAAINELVSILKQHNLYKRRVHYSSEDPSKFDIRHGFWFHVDGALGAAHFPFLEMAINEGLIDNPFPDRGFPVFDFRIPEIMSIVMSSHKWLGSPFPSGIFMTRRRNQLKPVTDPYYISGGDTTLGGSRNGHIAMILWDLLSRKSHHDLAEQAVRGEKMAAFTLKKLQELQEELGKDLWVSRSPCSLFICFKQPRSDIVRRYSLACQSIQVKTKQGALERRLYSRICLMSHVDEKLVGNIIEELNEPGAFPDQDSEL